MPPASPDVNVCPHCGSSPCLPWWRKLTLGPTGSARCRVCGQKVGADVRGGIIALLPIYSLLVVPVLALVVNPFGLLIPVVVCIGLWAGLSLAWVPLRLDAFSVPSKTAIQAQLAERDQGKGLR